MKIELPPYVEPLVRRLQSAGHEAWAVGGCVRDSLLGRAPHDWDLATSALPGETQALFAGEYPILETGLRHGTLTILAQGQPVEVTTYRVDGAYSDGRHPDGVRFTRSLEEDLARRDFTINAMAYSPGEGLADPFGGRQDLAAGLIRCVGEPGRRFGEDALRLLRGLRFASTLGFRVEPATAQALLAGAPLLSQVAAERVSAEITGLLCGPNVLPVLDRFFPVLAAVLPELEPMAGLDQRNPHHCWDVWQHTLRVVAAVEPTPILRWAALLHDVGKPGTFSLGEDGVGHFYGHGEAGALLAQELLGRLRLDGDTIRRVTRLVRYHGVELEPTPRCIRRWANRLGPQGLGELLALARGDVLAQAPPWREERLQRLDEMEALLGELVAQGECFALGDLAVGGRDLLAMGYSPGPRLGRTLQRLLEAVLDGACPNTREALLALAQGEQEKE